MADPLSIAGLVTGIISLGLQVAGGLSDYLDAVKGRPEELGSAKQQAAHMKDLILTIQDLLPQVKTTWPASANLIERHVQSCNTEISALNALLSELSQPALSNSGFRLKLAEQKQKLTYPFSRAHLSRLEERLIKVNGTLQTTLHATGLCVQQLHSFSITTGNELQQLHDISMATGDQVQQTHDVAINTGDEIRQIHDKLRQMHGELRAMCQSTTARTQSTADLLAASGIPQTIVRGGTGVPLDSMEAAASLVSRPSLLSTSIETVTWYNLLSLRKNGSSACLCRPLRKTSYHRKSWRYFLFSYTTSNTQRHLPSCPLSQIDKSTRATKFAIEYSGLKNFGAGGQSIAPNFAYYPVVNKRIAPAFRILELTTNMVRTELRNEDVAKVIKQCFENILIIYRQRRGSPKDIGSYGEHRLVIDCIFSGLANLITCGAPVATYDHLGKTNITELAKLLIPVAPDTPLTRTRLLSHLNCIPSCTTLMHDLKFAEAAGCGPLSLATIAGDERLSLREHPPILILMLKAGGSSIVKFCDAIPPTPLEFAYASASRSCIDTNYFLYLHESCRNDLYIALKQYRDELKQLALNNLTSIEAESLGLHNNAVLDANAFTVHKLLQSRGVNIPSHLYTYRSERFASVYHMEYSNPIILDHLWALGFRDIDKKMHNLDSVRWLIEHGADFWTPLTARGHITKITTSITPTHSIFSTIGCYFAVTETSEWLIRKLLQVRVGDTCSCPCSVGGCLPSKALFDNTPSRYYQRIQNYREWKCVEFIRAFDASLNKDDLVSLVRYMTFDALSLTHTCCSVKEWQYGRNRMRYTSEEIDEINSEQSSLLSLFADLVDEFEQAAFEDQGGKPLIVSDPEEFWIRRWLPRVMEILNDLDGDDLTQEEIAAAEAIGVVWGPQPVQTTEPENNIRDWASPEWVIREMEKIVNEGSK
ncbi:hypothetical protein F4679DRAFT_573349 [Xylaria curta]|nr:hypothetical protein F4679DRAFT_573349 [Xylaria curta]